MNSVSNVLDTFVLEKPRVGGLYQDLRLGSPARATAQTYVLDGGLEHAGASFLVVAKRGDAVSWIQAEGLLDDVGTAEVTIEFPGPAHAQTLGESIELEMLILDAGSERLAFRSDAVSLRLVP